VPLWCADVWRIPPVGTTLNVEGQPLSVVISGTVSADPPNRGQQTIRAKLDADLTDLQRNLTPLLRSQLDRSERCGERLSVESATLVPAAPFAMLTANLHFEKWACAKAFGKEVVKKLIAGDATVGLRLAPEVDGGNTLRLQADVTSIEAGGPLGELLRSGTLGDALREKIRATLVSALRKTTDPKATLPPAVQAIIALQSAEFGDGGGGRLRLSLSSEIRISGEQARGLLERLKPAVP